MDLLQKYCVLRLASPALIRKTYTKVVITERYKPKNKGFLCNYAPVTHAVVYDFGRIAKYLPLTLTHLVIHGHLSVAQSAVAKLYKKQVSTLVNVKYLWLPDIFNGKVNAENLPRCLTHLRFGKHFARNDVENLPPSITHIIFGSGFTGPIAHLPSNLQYLLLDNACKLPVPFPYPNLKYLRIRTIAPIDLPNSITHLNIDTLYDPIATLPSSLQRLKLLQCNMHVTPSLPESLVHISITHGILHEDALPSKITHLELGSDVQYYGDANSSRVLSKGQITITTRRAPSSESRLFPVDTNKHKILQSLLIYGRFAAHFAHLPTSITILRFPRNFNQSVDDLPPQLQEVYFGSSFTKRVDNLPKYLRKLVFESSTFNNTLNNLPNTLQVLSVEGSFDQPIDLLPANLQDLTLLNSRYKCHIHALPANLTSLSISVPLKKENAIQLPLSLTSLTLSGFHIETIPNLPSTLRYLCVKTDIHHPALPPLPPSLTHLLLSESYNHTLPELPNSLRYLDAGKFIPDKIPTSLRHLRMRLWFLLAEKGLRKYQVSEAHCHLTDSSYDVCNDCNTHQLLYQDTHDAWIEELFTSFVDTTP